MAKRLNKNLVVGLTLTGMLVTTVVAIWMLKNLRDQDPEIYITQAEGYAQDGKPALALKAYLRAHRAAGRTEPHYLILAGDQAMDAEDSEYALRLWGTAINLDPKSLEAQTNIVKFRLEQARILRGAGIWAILRTQAERLLELDDSLALGHNALGLALIGLKGQDPELETQGEEHLKRAVELAPDNPDSANDLAGQYVLTNRIDEARAVFLSFLEANPDSARGMMRYAEFLQFEANLLRRQGQPAEGTKKFDESKAVLVRALEKHPDDPRLHVAMGAYWDKARVDLLRSGAEERDQEGHAPEQMLEKVRAELEKAIELGPDAYTPYLALGQLYRSQQPPKREEALQVYKARYDRPPASRSGFKGLLNRQNQFRLCAQMVETLLEGYVTSNPSIKDKKRNQKTIQEAEKFLALAVSERTGENPQTYKLRGKILRCQNKNREAINELEKARAAGKRADLETLLLLADLYYKDGQLGVAYRAAKDALTIRSSIPAGWALLAQISLALDQPQHALESAEEGLKLDPNHALSRLLRAQALVALGRQDEVGKDLGMLVDKEDDNRGKLQKALILQLQDQEEEAIKLVLEVLANSPADREAVRMAVLHYQDLEQIDKAMQIVSRALQEEPTDRALQALKVNLEIEDPEERDAKLIEIIAQSKNPANRAIQMFNFYVARENSEKAREWLDKAEEIDPRSDLIIERQYRLALLTGDYPRAEEYVGKAARLNLDGANGEFFRGRLLLARGEYQRAVEVLRNAINTYPSNSQAYVYLGRALQMTQHNEDAAQAYKTALEYDPTNSWAHVELAKLAEARRDERDLYRHLDACAKFAPKDPWVLEQLQLKLEKEDPEAGIAKREQTRQEDPTNARNLLSLANLYVQTQRFDQAIEAADQVLKLDPNMETTWRVSRIYSQVGRTAEAESMLKKMVAEAEDEERKAGAQLALAEHYNGLAEGPEQFALVEEAFLQAATYSDTWRITTQIARWYHSQGQARKNRELLNKALEWYERAHEKAEQVSVKARITRLTLDALIAAREYEEAAKRIDAYIADHPQDSRGLLYKGETELQLGRLDNALAAFETYLERNPKDEIGYFRRGTIHYIRSEWDKAVDDLTQAKALAPDSFGYMHRFRLALALEQRKDVDEAVSGLQGLLGEVDPDDRKSEPAISAARLLCEILGRNDRAEAQRALATQYRNLLPNDPYWHTVLGQNALKMGNLYQASQHLKEACKLSNYAEPPVEAAMVAWIQAKDYDQAINFVTNEVPEDRRGGRTHLRWGQALAAKGDREGAKPHFVTALEMAARNAELSATVAAVMVFSMGMEGALEFAHERVKAKPEDRVSKIMLASLLSVDADSRSEALQIWREMVASAPSDADRLLPLTAGAQLAYRMKDFDTAQKYYERLLTYYDDVYAKTKERRHQANLPGVLNNLAYMLAEDLDRADLALPFIDRAVDMASDNPAILDTLGWVQVKLGRYREAIGTLSRALERDQNSPEYHLHMAEAYAREGTEPQSAAKEFQRAYELALATDNTELKQRIEKRVVELDIELMPPSE